MTLTPVESHSPPNPMMIVVITTFSHFYQNNLWTRRCTFLEVKVHFSPPLHAFPPLSILCSRCEMPESLSSRHTDLWPLKRGKSNLDYCWHPGDCIHTRAHTHTHTHSQSSVKPKLWAVERGVLGQWDPPHVRTKHSVSCSPSRLSSCTESSCPPLSMFACLRAGINLKKDI